MQNNFLFFGFCLLQALILLFSNYISFIFNPYRLSIRAGNHSNDLCEVEQVELCEPSGWVCIPLKDACDKPLRTFMIQIAVLSNHQNGRDTHIRRIKIRSPINYGDVPYPNSNSSQLKNLMYTIR